MRGVVITKQKQKPLRNTTWQNSNLTCGKATERDERDREVFGSWGLLERFYKVVKAYWGTWGWAKKGSREKTVEQCSGTHNLGLGESKNVTVLIAIEFSVIKTRWSRVRNWPRDWGRFWMSGNNAEPQMWRLTTGRTAGSHTGREGAGRRAGRVWRPAIWSWELEMEKTKWERDKGNTELNQEQAQWSYSGSGRGKEVGKKNQL